MFIFELIGWILGGVVLLTILFVICFVLRKVGSAIAFMAEYVIGSCGQAIGCLFFFILLGAVLVGVFL